MVFPPLWNEVNNDAKATCRPALRAHRRVVGHPAFVVTQGDVHEDITKGGLEADHQCFGVFAGLVAFLGGEKERGMYAEMESLIVQRRNGVAHDLVGQFEDGFFDQRQFSLLK